MPILTFVNRLDRESRNPFDLIDEIEQTLALDVSPASCLLVLFRRFADDLHRGHHPVVFVLEDMTVKDEAPDLFLRLERDEDEDAAVYVSISGRHWKSVVPEIAGRVGSRIVGYQSVEQMRGVLERLKGTTAVRHAGIALPREAELILMNVEIVQLVGVVDQLPHFAAMECRANV